MATYTGISVGYTTVEVPVGTTIQSAVNANPAGTRFLVRNGTRARETVIPKAGNVFVAETPRGVVMDGQSVTPFAFKHNTGASGPDDVKILGFVVKNYPAGASKGAIECGTNSAFTRNWLIDDCEIAYCGDWGVGMSLGTIVRRSHIHHNRATGIAGQPNCADGLVERCLIEDNNPDLAVDPSWGGGGIKWGRAARMTVRANLIRLNNAPGLWLDLDCHDCVLGGAAATDGNTVEDNYSWGIFVEISHDNQVLYNLVQNNVSGRALSWLYAGEIGLSTAWNNEVGHNTIVSRASRASHGLVMLEQTRPELGYPIYLRNNAAHDNDVTLSNTGGYAAAISASPQDLTVYTSNRFTSDTYHTGAATSPFYYSTGATNLAGWQSHGYDV